jgi:peptidoglycan/xylan/chitin deacetylase (PgdA/CDA1 family)
VLPRGADLRIYGPAVERRQFLVALAAGLACVAVGHEMPDPVHLRAAPRPAPVPPRRTPVPAATVRSEGPPGRAPATPPVGVVRALPEPGADLALTVDDGTSTEVVAAFAAFAKDSGVRLTFFPNGCYRSWAENAAVLRPLVDAGQVAFGNHTWSHADLTTLGDAEAADEIRRNQAFLRTTFGVRDSPFLRPPYGARNERIDRIAADLGHPTIAMWNGTLEDSRVLTAEEVLAAARQWFTAGRIVVGHANHPAVTTVYGDLLAIIAERGLRTVTLADVWATPAQRLRGAAATGRAAPG